MSFDAPRDNLVRANFDQRADLQADGRTMVGYPIVFDTWTEINSYEGRFKERVAPGAVARTLRNNGDQVRVLYDHGMDPQIGNKPLGKPTVMRAEDRGLYVEVPLDDTSYNQDLIASMRSGAIDGMSFRFSVVDESWDEPTRKGELPQRTITELRLYEFGPVTFPAYQATSVGIRSRDDFELWQGLTDEKRAAVSTIVGVDLRTMSSAFAVRTADDMLATSDIAGSEGDHPAVSILRRRALAAAESLRSSKE